MVLQAILVKFLSFSSLNFFRNVTSDVTSVELWIIYIPRNILNIELRDPDILVIVRLL